MSDVSIRDLRNRGGEVIDRAAGGELITITRAGTPVAELRPLPPRSITAEQVLERWHRLPRIDGAALRADVDAALSPRL